MKTWILRASTFAFAAGLAGTLACGSSTGCGGTNINANSTTPATQLACGPGTALNSSNQCVPTAAPAASATPAVQ
jgi:hypothetical protein